MERFEQFNLNKNDFKIEVHTERYNRHKVYIEIIPLKIGVMCNTENSQIKNKNRCLDMLYLLLSQNNK